MTPKNAITANEAGLMAFRAAKNVDSILEMVYERIRAAASSGSTKVYVREIENMSDATAFKMRRALTRDGFSVTGNAISWFIVQEK